MREKEHRHFNPFLFCNGFGEEDGFCEDDGFY